MATRLIHGSKTEIKKSVGQIFRVTITYLPENSKIKDKFFMENSNPEIRRTYFLAPKWGVDLYMGLTYTWVNTVFTD